MGWEDAQRISQSGREPVTKAVGWNFGGSFGIDEIHRLVGVAPSLGQILAREEFAHLFARAGIVDDGIAPFSEPDTNYQVAIVGAFACAFQFTVGKGRNNWDALGNPILQFRHIAESGHISPQAWK